MPLLGRYEETRILQQLLDSEKSEFLALYGRRRIGKTYLIRQFFEHKKTIFFNVTGTKGGPLQEQLAHFTEQISRVFYSKVALAAVKTWNEAFMLLTKTLEQQSKGKKIVLFFDELPWMATPKSRLLESLDYYWNQYWSNDKRIKLIICGSSASWIINKVIKNKGGLHNRITHKMRLNPFTLSETKIFLEALGARFNHQQILLLYLVTGGVPYYLLNIKKGLSAAQNIERLAFHENGLLFEEFDQLFASLFEDAGPYIKILRKIATKKSGIGRRELLKSMGPSLMGVVGLKKLDELEEAGFIMSFMPYGHKRQGIYLKLTDEYTLFYLKWIEPLRKTLQKKFLERANWENIQGTPAWYSWLGYAFESVCYKHISCIRKKLSLEPDAIANTWSYAPRNKSEQGAQIDLLFDRNDGAITICEIKCTESPLVLTKELVQDLERKITVFKQTTKTKKQLFLALISASGVKNNFYAEEMMSETVTLKDLFTTEP